MNRDVLERKVLLSRHMDFIATNSPNVEIMKLAIRLSFCEVTLDDTGDNPILGSMLGWMFKMYLTCLCKYQSRTHMPLNILMQKVAWNMFRIEVSPTYFSVAVPNDTSAESVHQYFSICFDALFQLRLPDTSFSLKQYYYLVVLFNNWMSKEHKNDTDLQHPFESVVRAAYKQCKLPCLNDCIKMWKLKRVSDKIIAPPSPVPSLSPIIEYDYSYNSSESDLSSVYNSSPLKFYPIANEDSICLDHFTGPITDDPDSDAMWCHEEMPDF